MCVIRTLFSDGLPKNREAAIVDLARALGYSRTGIRIRQVLDTDLRTAVRRGILASERRELRLQARSIETYDREFLKEQFLASLRGKAWIERNLATQHFARWVGFRRTGKNIEDIAKSIVNGLLREGRLEGNPTRVRKM